MSMLDWHRIALERKQRIEVLEETVRQLREVLRPKVDFPAEWRLTPAESRAVAFMGMRGEATRAALQHTIADGVGPVDDTTLKVTIHNIRSKLEPYGVKIGTSWGKGYYLTDKSRDLVKAALCYVDVEEA